MRSEHVITYDATNNALYAGTGEANASGDSEVRLGIWKTTNGGNTWTQLPAMIGPITTTSPGTGTNGTYGPGNAFIGRSISSIVVDPTNANHLYVSSSRGVRGVSSVTGGGTTNPPTARPPFGLFESTDGGATLASSGTAATVARRRAGTTPSRPFVESTTWRSIQTETVQRTKSSTAVTSLVSAEVAASGARRTAVQLELRARRAKRRRHR